VARSAWKAAVLATATLICSLAWSGPAAASAWTGLVANNQYPNDSVTTFDPVAKTTGQNINVGGDTTWVGPSPDGTKAYASTVYPSAALNVIDLASNSVTSSVSIPGSLYYGAVSPDGRHVYLAGGGTVLPIDVSSSPPVRGTAISVPNTGEVAFSPDGQTAWVATGPGSSATGVVPIDVATGTVGTLIPTGSGAFGVAVSPDGRSLWVSNSAGGSVSEIDTATRTVIDTVPISAGQPFWLAMSPDGSRLWVTLRAQQELTWINTSDGSVGTTVSTGAPSAIAVAVTPDAKTAFVTDGSFNGSGQGSQVTPVDATSNPPTAGTAMSGYADPVWDAITPDQGPVANFTVQAAPSGSATTFDASSSLAPGTPIVSYAWDFGDGASQTTTAPTVSHVYAQAGTYYAKLTETDAAGTSTTVVYTGQQTLRNGGPGASATKSVIVGSGSSAGAPQATLSTGNVDFGTVGLGKTSVPRAVTVTDTGATPLVVSSTTIGGADAGEFHVTSDGCGGATIAPGTSCTTMVTFAPNATGARTAQIAFSDNASGSPHTAFLTGIGTDTGTLTGTVSDSDQGGTPISGATLQICPHGHLFSGACRVVSTDAQGAYTATLPAGTYDMQVNPPSAGLITGSASVAVSVGAVTREDFPLHAPTPFPSNVTIVGVGGTTNGGVPVINWAQPFTLSYPIDFPGGLGDGTKLTVLIQDTINGTGAGGGGIGLHALTTAQFARQGGQWVLTGQHAGPAALAASTGCEPPPPPPFNPVNFAGYPAAINNFINNAGNALNPLAQVNADVGQQMHGSEDMSHTEDVYVDPVDCIPDPANPGHQQALCPPGSHRSNGGQNCSPDDQSNWNQWSPANPSHWNSYVDPSGTVVTSAGAPVPGATVWLERSSTRRHPKFKRPPSGSATMIPSVNPEHTNAAGFFQWDVIPGYYRVRASHNGCTAPTRHSASNARSVLSVLSPIFKIPPPRLNVRLVLSCPGLHRLADQVVVSAKVERRIGGQPLALSIRIAGIRGRLRPSGMVTIRAGRRVLAQLPVNSRTGKASIVLLGSRANFRGALVVVYSGDGYFTGSRSRVVRVR
jgi:YVTN family beta-propeller protein